jgi:carbon-monoxide dehydrogenase medium subunit/xanthine dehydrogenase FAD-binding subunit
MIPQIEFVRPKTLHDALSILAESGDGARVIAGGTDVIPGFQQGDLRLKSARTLVDIHHLPELKNVETRDGGLAIGAGITFTDLAKHPIIAAEYPLLKQAALTVGNVQIRNRATLAGNFVNNAACADSVPPLLVYNAVLRIQSHTSVRETPLSDFLLSPNQVQLNAGELVTNIFLPKLSASHSGEFYKLGRRRGTAISRITLAVLLKVTENRIEDLRIASGAVTPIGMRFIDLEKVALGKTIDKSFLKSLANELGEHVLSKTGIRWSTPYKLPVLQQMFFQLLCRVRGCSGEAIR